MSGDAAAADPFRGFPLETRIGERARDSGVTLDETAASSLAAHARAVLRANPELHLTSIVEPEEFVERHLGEAFEGAALLDPGIEGRLLDLGSGNGYPGLPLAAARTGLRLLMVEAGRRKAEFLRTAAARAGFAPVEVLERQVQRAADLPEEPPVRVLAVRAVGGWSRIVPRLVPCLAPHGVILLWCGDEFDAVSRRVVWRRLRLVERRPLPGRDRSWVCLLERAVADASRPAR